MAKKYGFSTSRRHQIDLRKFPLEKARLQIAFPMLYLGIASMVVYGWTIEKGVHIAAPLVLLFLIGYFLTGSFNILSTLLVDLNPQSPSTATAANNLVRCLTGAAATALIVPMLNAMGNGWTFTLIACFLMATSPIMMALWVWGPKWREEKRVRMEREKGNEAKEAEDLQAESRNKAQEGQNEKETKATG
jgi:sugar phosphate permease